LSISAREGGFGASFLGSDLPLARPRSTGPQLGGSDPCALAECALVAEDKGYDEVNLNVGCPSERVRHARFGASLMAEPDTVARCVEAMRQKSHLPVTVKTRIGIDSQDSYEDLAQFVLKVAAAGCRTFIVHSRKAWLKGLNPKQNRILLPMNWKPLAHSLLISINGSGNQKHSL